MKPFIQSDPDSSGSWLNMLMKYTRPNLKKSLWQIFNSLIPYILMWYLMYLSLQYSYLVTLLLAIVASGFLIRIFIIFHDCGHRSFFKSKSANNTIGMIMGIITFTPFHRWHNLHKVHHATSGNLDKRGVGDVWTMTVTEYINSSGWNRLIYRTFRNPFIMFTLGPVLVVMILNRLTNKKQTSSEKRNILLTNLMVIILSFSMSLLIGIKAYLLIQLPVILISHSLGIWLFYIQHQFDNVVWERDKNWNYIVSAIRSSSYLKLPRVFQWFTGNIGYHHIHHLSSRIPNYLLEKCHYENEIFKEVRPISFFSSFRALTLGLWDEASRKMVSFRKINFSA